MTTTYIAGATENYVTVDDATQASLPFETGAQIARDLKEFSQSSYALLDRDDI